ncbi:nucleoside-diphosphate-sugar epimerase [Rubidibacter lacunae KORDI 51-2]|uniref:Nucleoside-diphosphate-sugar epimerase n=1 Tax=Rubidibacter lacunae KORDI 51-2 TaxID=582515 RepID=U5DHL7_9CHRO|nr:NAD-dependent epimerase/dehydratase family protein [Rubidibacter lacunae]ERN41111.1 nucleoside-diphosphate-sugar epimerase [Rubidibacter lacunae KORDI 51-2]
MKAFVTGATGFTGSHLVARLLADGATVVCLVRASSDRQRLSGLPVESIEGDLGDRAALARGVAGADVVFHTAAYVELGIVDEIAMERANIDGTRAVLEAARDAGVCKVIYCSTIGVLGDTGGRVVDETFQRQQAGFSSAYDRTKLRAQEVADEFAAAGLPVVSVLPAGILGADDPHFGKILQLFLRGKLPVWAGGDRPTGVVHVDDLVDAMLRAAEVGRAGDRYIISAGELTTRAMFEIAGSDRGIPGPREIPRWLVRTLGTILDPIGRLTGWQPPLSRERVHYLYDRCVRVDASKARQELQWQPRSPETLLRELAAQLSED